MSEEKKKKKIDEPIDNIEDIEDIEDEDEDEDEDEKKKNKKDKREDVPTWGQKLMETVEKLSEQIQEEPQKKGAQEVKVPKPPTPKDPPVEVILEDGPKYEPPKKTKSRNFLDWLF